MRHINRLSCKFNEMNKKTEEVNLHRVTSSVYGPVISCLKIAK